MPTKKELSEEINDRLGTRIKWEKMHKDDLVHFKEMVDSGELAVTLGKEYAKNVSSNTVESKVDDWEPGEVIARLLM